DSVNLIHSGTVEEPVSYYAEPRQDLEIKEERIISLDTRIDPIQAERVGTSQVGNAFAQKNGFVAGVPEAPLQLGSEIFRRTVRLAEGPDLCTRERFQLNLILIYLLAEICLR